MFNHTTKTAGNIEHNLQLSFLVDSRPSITNKYSAKDVGKIYLHCPSTYIMQILKLKSIMQ